MTEVTYHHPIYGEEQKPLCSANIIWAERDRGSSYYRVSKYAMKAGKFPDDHPCSPFDDEAPKDSSQLGGSKKLTAFRSRGYWASCFPEGDGITLYWWEGDSNPSYKTPRQVMNDIEESFGWTVKEAK